MSEERSSGCGGIVAFLLLVALIIGGMFAAGWLYLVQTPTETQIIIDKEKVKTDTGRAVEAGKEMVEGATERLDDGEGESVDEEADADSESIEEASTESGT